SSGKRGSRGPTRDGAFAAADHAELTGADRRSSCVASPTAAADVDTVMVVAVTAAVIIAIMAWLLVYMLSQKPVTTVQRLIQQGRYADAVGAAGQDWLHRAEALKLQGHFEEAIDSYRRSDDPAAREGIALSLAHLGRDLDEAQHLMEQQIALFPQIQEFQALGL